MYSNYEDSIKLSGVELVLPNSQTTLLDFCVQSTYLAIEDETPSAKGFYEEQRNKRIGPPRIEERNEQLEQLEKELEEEENLSWFQRRRKRRSEPLKDWLYQIGIDTGQIEHGKRCKCCSPPHKVKRNEEIWAEKWKQIQKQKKLTNDENNGKEQESKDWEEENTKFESWRLKWGFF